MADDSYADARRQVTDLLCVYSDLNDSRLRLYRHLGRRTSESLSPEQAVAARLVALLTKGTEEPVGFGSPLVLAGDGSIVRVEVATDRVHPVQGACAVLGGTQWNEVALVVFEGGRPVAVHIIDRERVPSVYEKLDVLGRGGLVLSHLFHCNVLMEPVVSYALGIRTFLLDGAGDAGWERVAVV